MLDLGDVAGLRALWTVNDLELRGKRVFVRVDFNVPMEEKDGRMVINDATRIKETLPTLDLLVSKGAKVILASHLGRPKGQRDPASSLRPVAEKLADMIHRPVAFVDDCVGEKVAKTISVMQPGDILPFKKPDHARVLIAEVPAFEVEVGAFAGQTAVKIVNAISPNVPGSPEA